jgi:hypothetical protein
VGSVVFKTLAQAAGVLFCKFELCGGSHQGSDQRADPFVLSAVTLIGMLDRYA